MTLWPDRPWLMKNFECYLLSAISPSKGMTWSQRLHVCNLLSLHLPLPVSQPCKLGFSLFAITLPQPRELDFLASSLHGHAMQPCSWKNLADMVCHVAKIVYLVRFVLNWSFSICHYYSSMTCLVNLHWNYVKSTCRLLSFDSNMQCYLYWTTCQAIINLT